MNEAFHSHATGPGLIHPGALARALFPPVLVWGGIVLLGNLAGQQGVVCITPMAWLLVLWSGTQYIQRSAHNPGRRPLLAAAILGAALGVCLGAIFALGISQLPASPSDAEKLGRWQVWVIFGAIWIGVCALLSTFTAWLALRQLKAPK